MNDNFSTLLVDGWICNNNDSSTLSSLLDRRKPCFVRLSPNDDKLVPVTAAAATQPSIAGIVLSCDNGAAAQYPGEEFSLDWNDHDCIVIVEEEEEQGTNNNALPPRLFKKDNNHRHVRCLMGDATTAFHLLQRRQGGDAHGVFVWKPPRATRLQDWEDLVIAVYQMRSLGCAGLVLSLPVLEEYSDENVHALNRVVRKFQRPCSAMDYPPTIYMIGEDEIR